MAENIAVFFGGRSCEHDISILSALQVMHNLDKKKYRVYPIYMKGGRFYSGDLKKISAFLPFVPQEHRQVLLVENKFFENKKKLKELFAPTVALLCTHGGEGEDGTLQALLEHSKIPYTSAGVLSSSICMNKAFAKEFFEAKLLNTLKYVLLKRECIENDIDSVIQKVEGVLEYPLIVKPCSLGSSIGIEIAKDEKSLKDALKVACYFDQQIIVEKALEHFVEINCAAMLDSDKIIVSETEQPLSWNNFLSYDEKYSLGKMSGAGRKMPAPVADEINEEVKEITKRLYAELDLRGVVRIDFLFDLTSNKLFVNEINTIPGSLAFYLFEPLGISFSTLLDKMIAQAKRAFKVKQKNSLVFQSQVLSNFSGGAKGKYTK